MNKECFDELLESVKEGADIINNRTKASRSFEINNNSVKELRLRNKLTQDKFAQLLGISVGTLKNWEQGRRKPTGPANILLKIVDKNPEILIANL